MDPYVLELVKSIAMPFERLYLDAYWDPHPHGLPTQGWGRLLSRYSRKKHLDEGKTLAEANEWLRATYPRITREVADQWLEEDIEKANDAVKRLVGTDLTAGQEAALTDFAYNVGPGNLQISTLLRMVKRGDYTDAAEQFKLWNKSGGVVLKGLVRRRAAEALMFMM